MNLKAKTVGFIGLSSVLIMTAALLFFGSANKDFHFFRDFISKLGAKNEPYALGFNIIGFITVGLLLFIFGWAYGTLLKDKLVSILLSLFGLGFAFTAIPVDMEMADTPLSKAHTVAICLGLAAWLFGLSRLGYNRQLKKSTRNGANFTAVILVVSIVGFVLQLWSMPITHRLVFAIIFGWTAITSITLIANGRAAYNRIA